MTLNGVMALFCVISANSGSSRAHCVKSSRSLSHLLMSSCCNRRKRHIDQFSRFCTAHGDFATGCPFPSKLTLIYGDSKPPCNTWFLWPTRVYNPNGISIGSAVFAGLTTLVIMKMIMSSSHVFSLMISLSVVHGDSGAATQRSARHRTAPQVDARCRASTQAGDVRHRRNFALNELEAFTAA